MTKPRRARSAGWLLVLLVAVDVALGVLTALAGATASAGCDTVAGCDGSQYELADALSVAFFICLSATLIVFGVFVRRRRRERPTLLR